ncbi:collagen alpha-1(III) chain-like [Passer montanus]|uniref:collagen alpha-1(III) chain-like n=1 Tax=Passer montanus TaxID=9160 RepID=UPI0019612F21|nr:collagen alpha-1(III) chain-like [Passer montanus]
MARLSVKEHLDGILSDFEALKKSFEAEDGDEAPGSLLSSGESHQPLQRGHPPRLGGGPGPSPVPSPVLRSRLGTGLATGRANGTGIARAASFQSRQALATGPGSDGESQRSSSSSLESPAPTGPPQAPGSPPAASPGLKKVPSHGCVFPVELDHPLRGAAASHGSLPALDLHIAEEPGLGTPWGTQSSAAQPRAHQPSSSPSSSALPPHDGTETAPGLPPLPEGPGGWDAAPRTVSRPWRVTLSASPLPSRRAPAQPRGQGEAAPAEGRAEGPPALPAPQAATFRLVSQPQTVQVSSQPAFLGGLVLGHPWGTPAAPGQMAPRGPCVVAAAPDQAADGSGAAVTPEHGRTSSCPRPSLRRGPLGGRSAAKTPHEPKPGKAWGDGDFGDRRAASSLLPAPGPAGCGGPGAERGAGSAPGPPVPAVPGEPPAPPRRSLLSRRGDRSGHMCPIGRPRACRLSPRSCPASSAFFPSHPCWLGTGLDPVPPSPRGAGGGGGPRSAGACSACARCRGQRSPAPGTAVPPAPAVPSPCPSPGLGRG